jgi:ankyrin repeat protein
MQALINLRSNAEISEMVSVADDEGRLPLHWALHGTADRREEKDHSEIVSRMAETVETLLNIRPDTINARDRQGATTFHYAVDTSLGFVAVSQAIEPLLSAKPSPEILNTRNGRGSTALGEAARPFTLFGGNLNQLADLVKTLITNGADARLCADKGRSFLHVLSNYSWAQDIPPALLDFLLETVDVNHADADGCTALHYLVKNLDQSDAILHLLSRGADVSAVDRKGNTPLHEVMKGKMLRKMYANREVEPLAPNLLRRTRDELILALLNAGASMDQTNIAGQTPKQVLDCVLEEREGQQQREAAKRAKWGEDPIIRQDRGRVVTYVNSGY